MLKLKQAKGFTLIEIIIVIVIISILAAVAIPNVSAYFRKGKETKAYADATTLASALNMYNMTLKTRIPVDETTETISWPADLDQILADNELMPALSAANFADALKNVGWNKDSKLFKAKELPYSDADLIGY